MRKKSASRRQSIIETASQVFQEMGFEHASMNEISARVGGSKATLYSYFSSKEELFVETIRLAAERDALKMFDSLKVTKGDIASALYAYGRNFIRLVTSPDLMAGRRLVYGFSGKTDIGKQFYERAPKLGEDALTEFLSEAANKGELSMRDPRVAARHLRGLLESSTLELCLLRVQDHISEEQLEKDVRDAVDVFLAAYGKKHTPSED